MKQEDYAGFRNLMDDAAEVVNIPKKAESAITFAFRMLEKYELKAVIQAMVRHLERNKTYPTPAEIIAFLGDKPEDNISKKFQQMVDAIRKHGYYASVKFADPKIHYVINRLGSWMHLCQTTEDEKLTWLEKDFKRLYEEAERSPLEIIEREATHLPGKIEVDNKVNGFVKYIPGPVLIGFEWITVNRPMLTDGEK